MVNASLSNTLLRFVALIAAALMAFPANAQTIIPLPVLQNDAVEVTAGAWIPGTARRAIAPRPPSRSSWPLQRSRALLDFVETVGSEGLDPADYAPDDLRTAIAAGEGAHLDQAAGTTFRRLAEDLRDGRTPRSARRQYLMDDPDADRMPTSELMARALASGDVAGVLKSLNPSHPDYAALRAELAATPGSDTARRASLRANMDRWRWLPRDLGGQYLLVNVPEYRLRLMVNGQVVRNYKTIVGTVSNQTPQMSEMVEGVIFNPNWTVPQSIVVGEGLGRRVLNNPAWARARGYTATRGANGYIGVVQAPGPGNALGAMKLDMPNAHAIFLHDTPSRELFGNERRALSHGCVRVENAMELALTLVQLGNAASVEQSVSASESGDYTRIPMQRQIPVYLGYFTMGRDVNGNVVSFTDVYGRDAPILAALERPRRG